MQRINKIRRISLTFYAIVLTFNLVLFIVVLGFFNQVLFLVYGYDLKLVKDTSIESFEAYRNIYKSRLPILLSLSALSAVSFIWTVRTAKNFSKWLYAILFLAFGIIALVSLTFLLFYFIIPGNVIH
jgi:hypothetical protein